MAIEQEVRDFIVDSFLLGGELDLSSAQSLLESGVVDSTGIVELVAFLEETYQIEVADKEMIPENLESISNIVAFVSRKLEDNATGIARNP